MEDINKKDVNKIVSMSKSQEIRFYITLIFILLGFLSALTEAYLLIIIENYTGNLDEIMMYLGLLCTLLGLISMHELRRKLKRRKIMAFRKMSFFICLLGYLSIFILIAPFLIIVFAFLGWAISGQGLSGLN